MDSTGSGNTSLHIYMLVSLLICPSTTLYLSPSFTQIVENQFLVSYGMDNRISELEGTSEVFLIQPPVPAGDLYHDEQMTVQSLPEKK